MTFLKTNDLYNCSPLNSSGKFTFIANELYETLFNVGIYSDEVNEIFELLNFLMICFFLVFDHQ